MKLAFIGLGAMGGPMALNIIKKGTNLSVYDIEKEKMQPTSSQVLFQEIVLKILLRMQKLL